MGTYIRRNRGLQSRKASMSFRCRKQRGETDLLFPAQYAKPETMRQLRLDCGGLLFLAIGHEVGEKFGMPYLKISTLNLF